MWKTVGVYFEFIFKDIVPSCYAKVALTTMANKTGKTRGQFVSSKQLNGKTTFYTLSRYFV